MGIDGAAVAFLGQEKAGPAIPLPSDLEQFNWYRLQPLRGRVVAHLPLPDGEQLIVADITLPDQIEIIPVQGRPAFFAADAALSAWI